MGTSIWIFLIVFEFSKPIIDKNLKLKKKKFPGCGDTNGPSLNNNNNNNMNDVLNIIHDNVKNNNNDTLLLNSANQNDGSGYLNDKFPSTLDSKSREIFILSL